MRERRRASDQVSARFYAPGYRHGRAFHPRGLQPGGLPRAVATDRTRLAPRFIGLVEGFLTPLPAEHPKQTPLFFIFPREGDLPNWSRA
jgi:hypothetical protein